MTSCNNTKEQLSEIHGVQLKIDTALYEVDSINSYVEPYRNRINQVLDSSLAYAPTSLLLDDGKRNTSLGNLIADIVLEETAPVFKSRTGEKLDFVVLNRGGLRSIISSGNVTARNAYEVMPFENYISVVRLNGTLVRELINFLVMAKREHPIAGIQIILDKKGALDSVNIDGSPFDESRSYYIATSDYLVQGGAEVGFFKNVDSVISTDYLLRNAIIDHFKKVDTLRANIDDRFIQLD